MAHPILCWSQLTPFEFQNVDWSFATVFSGSQVAILKRVWMNGSWVEAPGEGWGNRREKAEGEAEKQRRLVPSGSFSCQQQLNEVFVMVCTALPGLDRIILFNPFNRWGESSRRLARLWNDGHGTVWSWYRTKITTCMVRVQAEWAYLQWELQPVLFQTFSLLSVSPLHLHNTMSDRPRRSTRQPPKYQNVAPAPTTTVVSRQKRKAQDADPVDQLRFLLQNPKSVLTTMDISVRWLSIATA